MHHFDTINADFDIQLNEYTPPSYKKNMTSNLSSVISEPDIGVSNIVDANDHDNHNPLLNDIHDDDDDDDDLVHNDLLMATDSNSSSMNNSFIFQDPTIYDAWNYIYSCLFCRGCICCKTQITENTFNIDDNWDDEVEKVMKGYRKNSISLSTSRKQRKHQRIVSVVEHDDIDNNNEIRDLQAALLSNDNDNDNNNKQNPNPNPSSIDIYPISSKIHKQSSVRNKKRRKQYHDRKDYGARMKCFFIPCIKYKPHIWQLIVISLAIQFLSILLIGTVNLIEDESKHAKFQLFAKILLGILWLIQLTVSTQLILVTVHKLWDLKFWEIMNLYLISLIIFTGIYTSAYFYDNDDEDTGGLYDAFNINIDTQFKRCTYILRVIAFFYFSCSQQTLCGVSEIIPKSPPTMILAGIQMGIGIFFIVVIISIAISRLGEDVETRMKDEHKSKVSSIKNNELKTYYDNLVYSRTCWNKFKHNERVIWMRRISRKYLLLIVVTIQTIKTLFEWIKDGDYFRHDENPNIADTRLIFVIFDVFNIALVIVTSLKFIHIGHMTELKLNFLFQTYLSCVLIFGGIYCDLQTISGSYGTEETQTKKGAFYTGESKFASMLTKFCYFSFAIMTLCGSGLNIKPRTWYACIAVCLEMLLGLFFHVYIFGVGLLLLATKKYNSQKQKRKNTTGTSKGFVDNESDIASALIMSTLLYNGPRNRR